MSNYWGASCPVTSALRTAITGASAATLTVRLRPTWTGGNELAYAGFTYDDLETANETVSGVGGLYMTCESNRHTDGTARNVLGGGYRYEPAPGFNGAASLPSNVNTGEWVDVAVTARIDANPHVLRIFDRVDIAGPWSLRHAGNHAAAATTFRLSSYVTTLFVGCRNVLFGGAPAADFSWPGGIASCSLAIGTGVDGTPGGTPIAAWAPEPPNPVTTDPHGNVWTVRGPDWLWGTVS